MQDHYLREIERKKANTEPNKIIQLVVQTSSRSSKSLISKLYKGIAKTRGNTTNYNTTNHTCSTNNGRTCVNPYLPLLALCTGANILGRTLFVCFFITPKMKVYLSLS